MSDYDPLINLGLNCPYEGLFYICSNDPIRFIGCCSINPCGTRKGLCPDQHLKPASFDKAHQGEIPPQACVNDNVDVAWFTCPGISPPFIGCCAVDPCSRGSCPRRELRAAKLSDKTKSVDEFLGGGSGYIPGSPSTSYTPVIFDPVTSLGGGPDAAVSTAVTDFVTFYTQQPTLGTTTPTSKPDSGDNGGGPDSSKTLAIALSVVFTVLPLVVILLIYRFHSKTRDRMNRWRGSIKTKRSKKGPETTQDDNPQDKGPIAPPETTQDNSPPDKDPIAPPEPNQASPPSNGSRLLLPTQQEAGDIFRDNHCPPERPPVKRYILSDTQAGVMSRMKSPG
ncbi:hypothetical protein ACHAPU_005428 [Fusarium lateritium]